MLFLFFPTAKAIILVWAPTSCCQDWSGPSSHLSDPDFPMKLERASESPCFCHILICLAVCGPHRWHRGHAQADCSLLVGRGLPLPRALSHSLTMRDYVCSSNGPAPLVPRLCITSRSAKHFWAHHLSMWALPVPEKSSSPPQSLCRLPQPCRPGIPPPCFCSLLFCDSSHCVVTRVHPHSGCRLSGNHVCSSL